MSSSRDNDSSLFVQEHGGNLTAAVAHWNIPVAKWLNLSTGINPDPWPVPEIPPYLWQQLPDKNEILLTAAKTYYQTETVLPIAGTQQVIQNLPALKKTSRVLLPAIAYTEHQKNWMRLGHQVFLFNNQLPSDQVQQHILDKIDEHSIDVLVIVNPNNPLGTLLPIEILQTFYQKLQKQNAWLIIDEAFMDTHNASMLKVGSKSGLLVLRSMGKFFGLAGARVGFVCGDPQILESLEISIGPWAISHPAQYIAIQALQDRAWQNNAKKILREKSLYLKKLLQDVVPAEHVLQILHCDFFVSLLMHPQHASLYFLQLAKQGVLIRHFPINNTQSILRFGLLPSESVEAAQRLVAALRYVQVMPLAPQ